MQNRLKFIFVVFCVMFMMQFFGICVPNAYADRGDPQDITGTTTADIITGVELTDIADNPLGTDVPKNDQFRLTYLFNIPSNSGLSATAGVKKEMWLYLPNEVHLPIDPSLFPVVRPVNDIDTGVLLFTAYLHSTNEIQLIFEDAADNNLHGYIGEFYFEMAFNASQIGSSDPVTIQFDAGGTGIPIGVDVYFLQDPPPAATVLKTDTYNQTTNTVTWTIRYNNENLNLGNVQISDVITAGHEIVPGSLEYRIGSSGAYSPALVGSYIYNLGTRELLFTPPAAVTGVEYLRFQTVIDDSVFLNTTANQIRVSNQAQMITGSGVIDSNTSTSSYDYVSFINKQDGTFVEIVDDDFVDWVIVVNTEEVDMTNVYVTDQLPEGLSLFGSPTFTSTGTGINPLSTSFSTSNSDPDGDGILTQDVIFNLYDALDADDEVLDGEVTIEFRTLVDQNVYLTQSADNFDNTAVLYGDEIIANNSDTGVGPGIDNDIMRKSGNGYDISTGVVMWSITVNPTDQTLQNVVVVDDIPAELDYIVGSFAISPNPGGTFNYDAGNDEITYTFPATITEDYTITYNTQIIDANMQLYKRNGSYTFNNTATFTSPTVIGGSGSASGNQPISSNIITKSADTTPRAYDYSTKTLAWRLAVNNNQNELTNVVVTDLIPDGQTYDHVGNTAIITDAGGISYGGGTFIYTTPATDATIPAGYSGKLVYEFGPATTINQTYYIEYETENIDIDSLRANGNVTISNRAYIDHDQVSSTYNNPQDIVITSSIIEKDSTYLNGTNYIDWVIIVNRNEIPIGTVLDPPVIYDDLPAGLYLDTGSIELYNLTIDADANDTLGTQVAINSSQVSYDVGTRRFEFDFQNPISTAYSLRFRTYIEDRSQRPFDNIATFDMVAANEDSQQESVNSNFFSSGGYANGNVGRLVITKYDVNDNTQLLQGAVFELYDSDGNTIDSQTTDSSGELIFDFIFYDRDYTYKEVTAPTNYIGDTTTVYTLKINSADVATDPTARSVEVYISNEEIRGNVEFTKVDDETPANPLPDAEFELFEDDAVTSTGLTATSQADGTVTFTNLLPGDYLIRETAAPTNFQLLSADIPVTVPQANSTQTYYPATNPVANVEHTFITTGKGRIIITKVDEDYSAILLNGAVFRLYDSTNTQVDQQTTATFTDTATGEVLTGALIFDDIYFDEDYSVREITPPTYYQLNPTVFNFRIDRASVNPADVETRIIRRTIENKMITGSITFTKYTDSYERLNGATFGLYNLADTEVATATSQVDGTVLFDDIIPGNYTIREISPPSGYHASTEELTATIPMGGGAVISNPDFMINDFIVGTLVVNVESDHDLTGREFDIGIFNSSGQLVYKFTYKNDQPVVYKDVPYGHYTAVILSNGYGYTGETPVITLSEVNGIIHLTLHLFINPNTSDKADYVMYIVFAIGLLLMFGGAAYYFIKRKTHSKN